MKYRVEHKTVYSGSEPVSVCHNQAWLQPRELPWQKCGSFTLKISPEPSILSDREDSFGNRVHFFSFNQGYQTLEVRAISQLELFPRTIPNATSPPWEQLVDSLHTSRSPESLEALLFTFPSPRIRTNDRFRDYARLSFSPGRPILDSLKHLTQRINSEFTFDHRATTVTTPVEDVFENKRGVCQDFAHLQIALIRSLGLPVRYISGYLRTIPPPGKPRLVGADASHAWVSVYCGVEHGWIDFDPTNNVIPGDDHLTVAWGRDYSDLPPLRGVFIGGGSHSLKVSVDVERLSQA